MRIITKEYKVYKFNELTDEAKEKVKEWYLDGQCDLSYIFTEDLKEDLHCLFGKNDLDVQYSLGYCQGDGLNIYGKINAENILNCLEKHNGGTQLEKFENVLTDKEKRTILKYAEECGKIELPCNNRYCYCLADYIEFANDWEYDLENYSYFRNINRKVLEKFETLVQDIFAELCNSYEQMGYSFFYEVDMEDLEDTCEANEWEFLEDGKLFW